MPMDETLGLGSGGFGGRAAAVVDTKVRATLVGDLQAELVPDFFEGFARGARANVHVRVLYGRSSHHKIEALFKALPAPCGWLVLATGAWGECCPAQREFYDRDWGLRRRKSEFREGCL